MRVGHQRLAGEIAQPDRPGASGQPMIRPHDRDVRVLHELGLPEGTGRHGVHDEAEVKLAALDRPQ
jgi:hypothetical protein